MTLKTRFPLTLLFLSFLIHFSGFSQEVRVFGKVLDAENKLSLPGVSVLVDSSKGTFSDENGNYELFLDQGKHHIEFSLMGYDSQKKRINIIDAGHLEINASLSVPGTELDIVVISGSQYEKKISEETVSIDIIKNYVLENIAAADLSEGIRKVSSVNIIDGQVSIRGGSPYTYGAGSRVQLLVDDLPLLSGDIGDINWRFVPMEIAKQTEIIKGSASALYGSSALNGVINLRTGFASSTPETKINIYQGLYFRPRRKELKWWKSNFNPFFAGAFFSHRRRVGENLDLVLGGNLSGINQAYENFKDQSGRFLIKTRYTLPKNPRITFGINGTISLQQYDRFVLWLDNDGGAYKPLPLTGQTERYLLGYIDPHFKYVHDSGMSLAVKARFFNVKKYWTDESLNSRVSFAQVRYNQPLPLGFHLSTGLQLSHTWSRSNLFGFNTYHSFFGSAYLQAEKKVKKLSLVVGVRNELNYLMDSLEKAVPVFRAGANLEIGETTFLRGSMGQGYRIPSLAERFLDTEFGGLKLFPNPSLLPEKGMNIELGLKQGIKINHFKGYVDGALFWTEFKNMTEFVFHLETIEDFGFISRNVSNARVAGLEISSGGEGKINGIPLRMFGGYTFNYAGDLEADTTQKNIGVFLKNLFISFAKPDSVSDKILKYRNQHMFRYDAEVDIKQFTIGASANYNSFMSEIDPLFQDLIPGVKEFREINDQGDLVLDARVSYRFNQNSTITAVVKNLTNAEYAIRPGKLEPPISLTLQYRCKF